MKLVFAIVALAILAGCAKSTSTVYVPAAPTKVIVKKIPPGHLRVR